MKKAKNRCNLIITVILSILPIIYFAFATYWTLNVFTIKLHTDLGYETETILQMHDVFYESLMFNGIWVAAYALFLIFVLIDIMLYKQSKKTIFITFNIAVLIAAIVSYFFLEILIIPLIFVVLAVVCLGLSYKLK